MNSTKSTQCAPKFAYLRSKIDFFSPDPSPVGMECKWGGGRASILTPSALEIGVPRVLFRKRSLFPTHCPDSPNTFHQQKGVILAQFACLLVTNLTNGASTCSQHDVTIHTGHPPAVNTMSQYTRGRRSTQLGHDDREK